MRYALQQITTAKIEGFLAKLDDRVAGAMGHTHSVETLGKGHRDTLRRVVKVWSQQQAAAYKAGLPVTNAVALSDWNLVLNEQNRERHRPHRKTTARRHLQRLAYSGILLGDSATRNAETGYAAPATLPGAKGKRVYFLAPALCAWEALADDATVVVESDLGVLDVRTMAQLRSAQDVPNSGKCPGVTQPPAQQATDAPGATTAPTLLPFWQTTYTTPTGGSNCIVSKKEKEGKAALRLVSGAAGSAPLPATKSYAPGAHQNPAEGVKHETPEAESTSQGKGSPARREKAAKILNDAAWLQHCTGPAREMVAAYRALVEPHNPQAITDPAYWISIERVAVETLALVASEQLEFGLGVLSRPFTEFVRMALAVCREWLPERIAAGRWKVMVSARQFFEATRGYNLKAAIEGYKKWEKYQKNTGKTGNNAQNSPKNAPKSAEKRAEKAWTQAGIDAFLAEYTHGNISKVTVDVWQKLCHLHPQDVILQAADLRSWRDALIELHRIYADEVLEIIQWWLGVADEGKTPFLTAAKRRAFWGENGGCRSLTGLQKRFAAMRAQFHEDREAWKAANKAKVLPQRRLAGAATPAPTFPGESKGSIRWDDAFMRDWDGTRTGKEYEARLQAAGYVKVPDDVAGQKSTLGYRYVSIHSGEGRKMLLDT